MRYATAEVTVRAVCAGNTKDGEVSTPRVPNSSTDSSETSAPENILSARDARNGFAWVRSTAFRNRKINKTQHSREKKHPAAVDFVSTVKAKHRKADKFIIPSMKMALRPAYSLTSAPKDASIRGADKKRILRAMSVMFFSFCVLNCYAGKHDSLYERAYVETGVVVESDSVRRRKNP